MSLAENVHPDGTGVYVWVQRLGSGARPAAYLSRWPATLVALSKEQALHYGIEEASHLLVGPAWPGKLLEAGDQVVRCRGRQSGRDYVRGGKQWSVLGRRHETDIGDLDHQLAFVKEPV